MGVLARTDISASDGQFLEESGYPMDRNIQIVTRRNLDE